MIKRNKKRLTLVTICLVILPLFITSTYASSEAPRPIFNHKVDTLLAQFDIKGDLDDIHAIAALGSMLKTAEFAQVSQRTYAVQGSVERTTGKQYYVPELMTLAFGAKNEKWFDALADHEASVNQMATVVLHALTSANNTGKVWVMEAGQNGFTYDWLKKIIEDDNGISQTDTKKRVIVVQHSWFNEEKSNQEKLAYVMKNTHYKAIDDGNEHYGKSSKSKEIRFAKTARLQGRQTETGFNPGDPKWMMAATSADNKKVAARALWTLADNIIKGLPSIHGKLHQQGGTDYSDVVEALWIFDLNNTITTNAMFWEKYVTTVQVNYQ